MINAVISGQAGLAFLIDGESVSSLHVHDLATVVPRRVNDFTYLFGGASDLVFREDVTLDDVCSELRAAADGEEIAQLAMLLLSADRPHELRETAATELNELLQQAPEAVPFAERHLFSTLLPSSAEITGATQIASSGPARYFLLRLEKVQPAIRAVQDAWRAISHNMFRSDTADLEQVADATFVREGIYRQFVLAAQGELVLDNVLLGALRLASVRSIPNHRNILLQWQSKLNANPNHIPQDCGEGVVVGER